MFRGYKGILACFLHTFYLYLHCIKIFVTIAVCNCQCIGVAVCSVQGEELDRCKALCYIFCYSSSEVSCYKCRICLKLLYNKCCTYRKSHLKKVHSMQIVIPFQSDTLTFHNTQRAGKCWCYCGCLKLLKIHI